MALKSLLSVAVETRILFDTQVNSNNISGSLFSGLSLGSMLSGASAQAHSPTTWFISQSANLRYFVSLLRATPSCTMQWVRKGVWFFGPVLRHISVERDEQDYGTGQDKGSSSSFQTQSVFTQDNNERWYKATSLDKPVQGNWVPSGRSRSDCDWMKISSVHHSWPCAELTTPYYWSKHHEIGG